MEVKESFLSFAHCDLCVSIYASALKVRGCQGSRVRVVPGMNGDECCHRWMEMSVFLHGWEWVFSGMLLDEKGFGAQVKRVLGF